MKPRCASKNIEGEEERASEEIIPGGRGQAVPLVTGVVNRIFREELSIRTELKEVGVDTKKVLGSVFRKWKQEVQRP